MASTLGAETDGDGAEEGAAEAASSLLLGLALAAGLATGLGLLVLLVALRTADAVIHLLASSFSSCSMESAAAVSTETRSVGSASFSDERAVGLQVGGRARIFRVAEWLTAL